MHWSHWNYTFERENFTKNVIICDKMVIINLLFWVICLSLYDISTWLLVWRVFYFGVVVPNAYGNCNHSKRFSYIKCTWIVSGTYNESPYVVSNWIPSMWLCCKCNTETINNQTFYSNNCTNERYNIQTLWILSKDMSILN